MPKAATATTSEPEPEQAEPEPESETGESTLSGDPVIVTDYKSIKYLTTLYETHGLPFMTTVLWPY
jgi:hypothetical protein